MTHKYLRSNNHISLAWQLSVGVLLCSGFLTGLAQWVGAEPLLTTDIANDLIAQDVVQGLPPPPPGQAAPPSQPDLPDRSPAPPQEQQTSDRRYIVVVNGDSSRLLSQVQRVASNATVQEYQGQRVIQVATFDDSDRAERQVQLLASRGIGAKILPLSDAELPRAELPSAELPNARLSGVSQPQPVQSLSAQPQPAQPSVQSRSLQMAAPDLPPPNLLPSQAVPREVNFNGGQPTLNQFPSPPPLPDANGSSGGKPENQTNSAARSSQLDASRSESPNIRGGRAYFVVIPGKQGELDAISNQVIRLGDGFGIAQLVQQTSEPRGPHVQVGPFGDRNAANRWNHYFRDFGMDARIYVRR